MANEFTIDTSLDTKGVEVGANRINKTMFNLGQSVQKTADNMSKSINSAFSNNQVPTEQYQSLIDEFDKISVKMDHIREQSKRFLATGGNEKSSTYQRYVYDLERLEQAQTAVNQKMAQMESEGLAYKTQLDATGQSANNVSGGINKLERAQAKANKTSKKGIGIFKSLAKAMSKQKSSLQGGFKNVLKYAFGIRSLFVLVNKLRGAVVDGFKNLAQFNGGNNEVNKSLSALKSSLTQLKNSLATAFAPILTAVAPILTTFINYLSEAITVLGMFFARLTGANTYTKAKKVTQQYADATQNAADAQEELNNKLGEYDKLAVVDSNSSNNSSGANSASNPAVAFETVQLNDTAVAWADKFREAWENADFTDIGRTISRKIAEALDNIPWDQVREKCNKVAKSVGTFINGFVEGGAFQSFGTAVAKGLNTALEAADTFLRTVNWTALGNALVGTITSFFSNFDFGQLGRTVTSLLVAGLDLISGIVNGVDWRALPGNIANAIKTFLTNVDWGNLLSSIGNLAGSILLAVWNWNVGLAEVIGNAGKKIVDYFKSKMDTNALSSDATLGQKGTAILTGILKGIIDGMASIASWIKTNIVGPFAKAMAKTGLFDTVGRNLWNGLKTAVEKVLKPFGVEIKLPTWTKLKSDLKTMINNMISYLNSTLIKKLNNAFSITIPKNAVTQWLGINGKHTLLKLPNIPKLATGAVIPPNHEFLAMLGDQKQGVNIETPLATMVEAFNKALDNRGGGAMPESIKVYLSDNRAIAEAVWDEEEKRYKQTGSYKPRYA